MQTVPGKQGLDSQGSVREHFTPSPTIPMKKTKFESMSKNEGFSGILKDLIFLQNLS
jgi:hypothetical protein